MAVRTCTWTKGATSVTVKAPVYPDMPGDASLQLVGRTWGGRFKIADMGAEGAPVHELTLQFEMLTRADWNSLRGFIVTTCAWSTHSFTYTDPWDVDHTNMRYVGGLGEAKGSKGDRWSVTVRIARDMEA